MDINKEIENFDDKDYDHEENINQIREYLITLSYNDLILYVNNESGTFHKARSDVLGRRGKMSKDMHKKLIIQRYLILLHKSAASFSTTGRLFSKRQLLR